MIGYIIFICSMAMAVICISYDSMARAKGWSVGEILSKDASLPKIAAFITALWVLGKSFMTFYWWSPILILVAGWILGFVLTMMLRKNVQFIGILGIFPALVLTILYISEQKPFGMLHKLFS
ncbi:MAG: hypothetical protein HFP77_05415 [Methylococcales symbiont of Iophon sp. n. MRB-2018]|nr:MAG: hypothetical protein HFP77_05415 [Methylococcales symbiont of Iophon sp. n. MRB-2018]KAF3979839.1 MAG: hypothetical protein HFP76_04965 [Methylococcales symbiont of Iophon sp. n. MRB-2018]